MVSDGLLGPVGGPVVSRRYVYADDVLETASWGGNIQWVPRARLVTADARYPPLRASALRDHRDGADADGEMRQFEVSERLLEVD